ncbi:MULTISPECIES: hypothetical protein [unclassified Brevundimonas]|uniref:hypothetical protein n=1 Tax=unclassified Brevundimonas TaxID=2622653 RepID=UPI0025BF515A|nr:MULTISPECIES: hypothetical protein [unclassified Brevundimonas]
MSGSVSILALWGLCLGLTALCWRLGGEPERRAAGMLFAAYAFSVLLGWVRIEGLKPAVVAADVLLAIGLGWLAIAYRRWWLLMAAANAVLVVIAHATVFLEPSIHQRAYIAYRMLPGLVIPLCAGLGAWERWLAGEPACAGWLRTRAA